MHKIGGKVGYIIFSYICEYVGGLTFYLLKQEYIRPVKNDGNKLSAVMNRCFIAATTKSNTKT